MYTRILFITFALLITLLGFNTKVDAQKIKPLGHVPIPIGTDYHCLTCCICDPDTPYNPGHFTSGKVVLNCNMPTLADSVGCGGFDASGSDSVNYSVSNSVFNVGNKTFIGTTYIFANNTSCNMNFVVCAMVQYDAPYKDQVHFDSHGLDKYYESENQWTLTQHTCGTCPTGCNWTCSDDTGVDEQYWSYYLGCVDLNLPPGQNRHVFSVPHEIDGPILAFLPDTSATKAITLSQNPANYNDTSITTWNYAGSYFDILKGCEFLTTSGCDFGNEPNQQLSEIPLGSGCLNPAWSGYTQIASHGAVYPTGIVSFPIGNQETTTMSDTNNAHTVYQAEYIGYLVGAPAGSELIVYAPEDTSGGACVIDSGMVWTDTVGDCQSDTLKFEFPFLIPPMSYLGRGMTFKLELPPDSCSNIGNGAKIYLNGTVFANGTTPLYDSGAFMYNTVGTMILDTSPPAVTNFIAIPVDSTRLAIRLTGVDIASKVIFGCVKYSLNGGPEQIMVLRFADSIAVGDTTTFLDTLNTHMIRPVVAIKAFVGNELGVLDSSSVDTSHLLFELPESVTTLKEDSFRVNYIMIDHQSKILTLDVQADGAPIELDLVTEDGRSTKLTSETSSPIGEQKFLQSISSFARGAYFLVIHSGNNSIVESIVL